MRRTLRWTCDDTAVTFSCLADGARVPLNAWAAEPAVDANGERAHPGVLLAMRDLRGVNADDTTAEVRVDASTIAQLPAWQARQLGLPPPPPLRLQLDRRGLLTDPDFTMSHSF